MDLRGASDCPPMRSPCSGAGPVEAKARRKRMPTVMRDPEHSEVWAMSERVRRPIHPRMRVRYMCRRQRDWLTYLSKTSSRSTAVRADMMHHAVSL